MGFAYWRKCDFQVHTPRDPNWTGKRPPGLGDKLGQTGKAATAQEVEDTRAQWASDFVEACVARGLEAVALTDHHEMVIVSYVQKAISVRKENDPGFDLWVFPGMELTCTGGKQCLILFDADLSEEWRKQAQGRLGIVYADLDEKSGAGPKVTQLTCNYADIAKQLNEIEQLRGKYIVLPNVSQGGQHTVLTDGNHADFRRMPYVGGYLDRGQTINTLGSKNCKRLSGDLEQWCEREIYPLPTSDSRAADYAHLGTNDTWIKLATPTAEAIRQAFLGQPSRIRIKPPEIPSLVVAAIEIQGAMILDDCELSMSPELNAVIGGRGSGKSTFLEYLSFGLGRSCFDLPRQHYSGTERLSALVNDTLVSKNGIVTLTIVQDNAPFIVVRGTATAYQPQITYPNGSQQTITVKELRALFPSIVYSQGELADIGKQTGKRAQLSDLLQFVNAEYKREDDGLSADIETAKNTTRAAIQRLTSNWNLKSKLRQLTTARDSLKQRVGALEKTLPKLSDDDQAKIDYFELASDFEAKRVQASRHADMIVEELTATANALSSKRDLDTPLTEDAKSIQEYYGAFFQSFANGIEQLRADIMKKRLALSGAEVTWAQQFEAVRTARDGALEKLGAHKTVTAQIINLREEAAELTNQIGDLEAELKAQGDPSSKLRDAIAEQRDIVNARAERTREWATEIEQLSSGKIKAIVELSGDVSQIKEAIDFVASKTGSQEATRLREIDEALKFNALWDWLDRLRTDCLSLLHWRLLGAAAGEEKPKCEDLIKVLGDTERIRTSLTELMDSTRVEAMSAAVPEPEITLFYCDGDREISFEKASEGQRAAALLFMLLEQQGGPLIIDQPEGDLDNKVITDLTSKLHSAKEKRPLVFASHNANIVVNGSSELVGHLDVREDGKRQFDSAGAIDMPQICKLIAETMEGGEKAFRDRKDKYGY